MTAVHARWWELSGGERNLLLPLVRVVPGQAGSLGSNMYLLHARPLHRSYTSTHHHRQQPDVASSYLMLVC